MKRWTVYDKNTGNEIITAESNQSYTVLNRAAHIIFGRGYSDLVESESNQLQCIRVLTQEDHKRASDEQTKLACTLHDMHTESTVQSQIDEYIEYSVVELARDYGLTITDAYRYFRERNLSGLHNADIEEHEYSIDLYCVSREEYSSFAEYVQSVEV